MPLRSKSTSSTRTSEPKKSADPDQATRHTPTPPQVDAGKVFRKLGFILVWILTLPLRILHWLTEPPGSALLYGLGALYFCAVSVEGYWQAFSPDAPSFVPKPFVDDRANPGWLLVFALNPVLWVTGGLALIVQAKQASILRDIGITTAKMRYEQSKKFTVDKAPDNAIDVVKVRRREYKRAGMKAVQSSIIMLLLCYGIDIAIQVYNFFYDPRNGGAINNVAAVAWLFLGVFGAEFMISEFREALRQGSDRAKYDE